MRCNVFPHTSFYFKCKAFTAVVFYWMWCVQGKEGKSERRIGTKEGNDGRQQNKEEVKVSEPTDLVAKAGDASAEVWREAVDGSSVGDPLWDRQGAVLSPRVCVHVGQLEEHLHRLRENISVCQRVYQRNVTACVMLGCQCDQVYKH